MAESPVVFPDTKIRDAVVKVMCEGSHSTGFIIGSKNDKCAILTVAHDFFKSGKWLTESQIQDRLRIGFYGDDGVYSCQIFKYYPTSDILVLVVTGAGRSPESKLSFPPASENFLFESMPLRSRAHPDRGSPWTFKEGIVECPKRVNSGLPDQRPMKFYDEDLLFFEHSLHLPPGCSGAPLVCKDGSVAGMHTGNRCQKFDVLGSRPVVEAIAYHEDQIKRHYLNNELTGHEAPKISLEAALKGVSVVLRDLNLPYKREHVFTIEEPGIGYGIHFEYLESMIRGGSRGSSLEDLILGA